MYATLQSNHLLSQRKKKKDTINNVLYKKIWRTGSVKIHVEPLPIPLIKSKNYMKAEKYCVKIKLRRDHTSEKSDLYEFKITCSDNRKSEEFLLFAQNFKMVLEATEMIAVNENLQYTCMLICGEALYQFYTFCT